MGAVEQGDTTAAATTDGRTEWLDWRRRGIGASDIAGILGISPWTSPWSVWADKVGLLPPEDESDVMEFGRWAERMIGPWFEHRTGLVVAGEQMRLEHPQRPWRRCTVDGLVYEHPPVAGSAISDTLGLLQIKTTGPSGRWDEIPPHVQAQEQWEMHVSGLDRAWVATLHGRRLEIYELARDDADIDLMVEKAERFWFDHVLTGQPPETDGHDATLRALAAVYPEHMPGAAVEIDHLAGLLDDLREAKAQRKAARAVEDAATAALRAEMGDAYEGTVSGQRAVTLGTQTRKTTCQHCGHVDESDPFRVLRVAKEFA